MEVLNSYTASIYPEKDGKSSSCNPNLPTIAAIGLGGSGNNVIDRLKNMGVKRITTIAVNTDRQHLEMVKADKKVLIGGSLTKGQGECGNPDVRKAAELERESFEELLSGAHMVFICAGMGSVAGASTVVAEIARDLGATVVGIVQIPFIVERARIKKAADCINELKKKVDTLIVLDNSKVLEYSPNLPTVQAFSVTNLIIAEAIKGISDAVARTSLMNMDFSDVKAVMSGGLSTMLVGESQSKNRFDVAKSCLDYPLLDVDYRNATGALIQISGGPDLTVKESEKIVKSISSRINEEAMVVWGASIRPELRGTVRVVSIVTGLEWKLLERITEELKLAAI